MFRLWIRIRGLLALVIVLAGLAVGLMSLLLPFESLYQDRLQNFLEKQWGVAVEIGDIGGSWRGYGPHFALSDLHLEGKQSLNLRSANLSINAYQWLIPGGRTGIDLSINRAELDMIHSAQGPSITINDDTDEARFTETLDRVLTTGALRVDEMTLNLADESGAVLLSGLKADLLLEQDKVYRALELLIEKGEEQQSILIKSKGLKSQSLTRDANWYIKFNQFDLSQLKELVTAQYMPRGQLEGELWLSAKDGAIVFVTGQLNWTNAAGDAAAEILIEQLGQQETWKAALRVQNIMVKNQPLADFEILMQRVGEETQVKTDQLPIALLYAFYVDLLNDDKYQELAAHEIGGVINDVALRYDLELGILRPSEFTFDAIEVNARPWLVNGLAGAVSLDAGSAQVLIDTPSGTFANEQIYRGQLNWQQLLAQAGVDWSEDDLKISLNNLWCACTDFNLSLWSQLRLQEVPHLILSARVADVAVEQLWKYWPHRVWKDKAIAWLDQALMPGTVDDGFVFIHGDIVPDGFKKGAADFISRAYISDLSNRFHPDWPLLENLNAVAVFKHDQVHVDVQQAQTMGIDVGAAQASIQSFDEGVLNVELTGTAKNNEIIDYIRQSPLVNNIELDPALRIGGDQSIDLTFDVPIKSELKATFEPQGQVVFEQGELFTEHLEITEINGPVQIDGFRLKLANVPAKLDLAPVQLNGEVVTRSAQGALIDVNMIGQISADFLKSEVSSQLPIAGAAQFSLTLANQQKNMFMTAYSDLQGMAVDLPPPLNKSKDDVSELQINCQIPCRDSWIELAFNQQIQTRFRLDEGQFQLQQLQFLDADQLDADIESPEAFGGYIKQLDLDQWLAVSSGVAAEEVDNPSVLSERWPVDDIKVYINELQFMSRQFKGVQTSINRTSNSLEINVENEAMKGQVVIDDDIDTKGILVQFERLDWVDVADEAELKKAVDANQGEVPDLHIWVKDFSYGGIPLGELRMEMRNVADGVKIDVFNIKSEFAEINITGVWNKSSGPLGQSKFHIIMISERVADFLKSVGFNPPITNAQTLIDMHAEWAGVPSQFNVANIDGSLDISIGRGQVLDQDPGFGRVLGLFNLTNLPRRLILDFRDVLADGLLFSSMEGHFEIKSGVATTDDFLIKASSAKIHINGDVGFADQSYAQTITVRPQIGKTFPTIGALAGGPVGAAAGFLVQGLLGKQLKNKNEIVYQVTGSWDEPQIELISDE